MVASYGEVVAAKALVGLLYVAVSVGLLLGLTRLPLADPPTFVAALTLLSVTLEGFGLLLGGLFRSASQLNTWAGFLILPVMAPPFAVGFPTPGWANALLSVIPVSQATRLVMNAVSGQPLFPNPALSFAVVALWGLAAYLLLLRTLRGRQA
jgi:ABC-2 type transport system permease protein